MTMRRPWQITAYRLATRLATPFSSLILRARVKKGKEDPTRLAERRGLPSVRRPDDPLVWVHGASVGETVSLTPLVERLIERGYAVLVTSGTLTSARVLASRLPAGAFHQFIPLDSPRYMRRFLKRWRPVIGIIAESEIWPNMIIEAGKIDLPLMLINARMTDRTHGRWSRQPHAARFLLARYDLVLAQSRLDAERYLSLGAPRVAQGGNLKFDVAPPPADMAALAQLEGVTAGRPVWIAASTHPGEDEQVIAAHRAMLDRHPALLTIIAPRHPERGPDIAALAREQGLASARRADGLLPDRAVDLYIADTIGELGLFYRLCPVAFLGGSLVAHGGQNPIEPAKLGAAIVHGPHVGNFMEVYRALSEARGAVETPDAAALAAQVSVWLENTARARSVGRAAQGAVNEMAGAVERALQAIEPLLARAALARRSEQER
jgi:3-deoxy-D-manno-octulosonic-acid transferase